MMSTTMTTTAMMTTKMIVAVSGSVSILVDMITAAHGSRLV